MSFLGLDQGAPKFTSPSQIGPNLKWGRFYIFSMIFDPRGYTWPLEVSLISYLPREPYIKTFYQFILTSIVCPIIHASMKYLSSRTFRDSRLHIHHWSIMEKSYINLHESTCVIRIFHVRVFVMSLHSTFVFTFKEHCIIINNCRSKVYLLNIYFNIYIILFKVSS